MKVAHIFFPLAICGATNLLAQQTQTAIFADGLQDSLGTSEISVGSPFIIVIDTLGDGFAPLDVNPFGGTISTSVGSFIDDPTEGDDLIVVSRQYSSFIGNSQAVGGSLIIYEDAPDGLDGVNAGDPFGIYWFPDLTDEAPVLSGGEFYGLFGGYSGTGVDPIPGDGDWVLPESGDETYIYDSPLVSGGQGPDLPANNVVTEVIPEPSAFGGVLALGALVLARRRG